MDASLCVGLTWEQVDKLEEAGGMVQGLHFGNFFCGKALHKLVCPRVTNEYAGKTL